MYIGTAARMAGWLKLHQESTYRLPSSATFEQVIEQEVARRTFWLMHCEYLRRCLGYCRTLMWLTYFTSIF